MKILVKILVIFFLVLTIEVAPAPVTSLEAAPTVWSKGN